MNGAPVSPNNGPQATPEAGQQMTTPVDVEQLADKVYRLMLAEVRLARARGERVTRRKGG
jgi:hypothetical protein